MYRESKLTQKKVTNWRRAIYKSLTMRVTLEVEKAIDEGTFLPEKLNGK